MSDSNIAAGPSPVRALTVVVKFFDMRREAQRTLYSLTADYQRGVARDDYEVIAIDNGTDGTLGDALHRELNGNFQFLHVDAGVPSPCKALNHAVRLSNSRLVMCLMDGARLLSPQILKYTLLASRLYEHPFIYTLGMHIGSKPQNDLVAAGYNQEVEDRLISSIDWKSNGYKFFEISSVAPSSRNGFFSELSESNCFSLRTDDFLTLGGFDEGFTSTGGGLANLDFFDRVHAEQRFTPVMLLGEATFHQFHGGVATNVPPEAHPWKAMVQEYETIKGRPFVPCYRRPIYFGELQPECQSLLKK